MDWRVIQTAIRSISNANVIIICLSLSHGTTIGGVGKYLFFCTATNKSVTNLPLFFLLKSH